MHHLRHLTVAVVWLCYGTMHRKCGDRKHKNTSRLIAMKKIKQMYLQSNRKNLNLQSNRKKLNLQSKRKNLNLQSNRKESKPAIKAQMEGCNEEDHKQDISIEQGAQHSEQQVLMQFKKANHNPHQVRKKRKKYVANKKKKKVHRDGVEYESEEEHSSEWDEPDFDEILSKPVAKYRWQLEDRKSAYGV
eukprot:905409_1